MQSLTLERPTHHATAPIRQILHVGCGGPAQGKLHPAFAGPGWSEVRLDIDPGVIPDVIASITNMVPIKSATMQALYSSHNLEHLAAHEVPLALAEFVRVLAPDGIALITVPDLQSVAELVVTGNLTDQAYMSPLGPIAPLDILYGFRPAIAQGNDFMGHRTGFTDRSLLMALMAAGFADAVVQRSTGSFSLWAIAFRTAPDAARMRAVQAMMFPHKVAQHADRV